MIVTDRTITVRKGVSSIDDPVIVYRGDYEVAIRFTIMNSKFKFMSGVNMIESEKASYGQLAILTPYGGNVFSDMVRCSDGAVTFVMTKELMDQIEEVGLYSFQIRLFDGNRESRISIPPVEFGIEVREPVASEDHDNSVNNAIVGYSIAKVAEGLNEDVGDTFDDNGNYNKTDWETGDRITEGKLNKIEDAIDKINQNEKKLDRKIDSNYRVLDLTKADKNEIFSMANMGQDIKEAMTGGSVAVVGANAILRENIVDGEITLQKCETNIQNVFEKEYDNIVDLQFSNGYWDYVHGSKIYDSEDFLCYDAIYVNEGDEFIISGCSCYRSNLYLIKDSSGNILEVFPNTNTPTTFYSDIKIKIPANGRQLCLNGMSNNPTVLKCVSAYVIDGSNILFKKNTIGMEILDDEIVSLFEPVCNDEIELTWITGSYYRYNNLVIASHADYSRAIYEVSHGEIYEISGTSSWEANLYSIVDENGKNLSTFPNTNTSSKEYDSIRFTIPSGGKYLYMNQHNGKAPTILKTVSGYKIPDCHIKPLNKKWVAFGDSLTDSITLGGDPNYTSIVSDKLGLELINCGVGGSGYVNGNGGTQHFYNRTSQIPIDTDIITVFGSFNDLYVDIPLGEITDMEPTSLYGAINKFLNNCWEINPGVIIGIISPTPWDSWWRGYSDATRVDKCISYVTALKTIAEYYSLPFLDLFNSSNLRPWDKRFVEKYYKDSDGVHPNAEGHKIIAPKIEKFIESIIENYD